MLYSCFCWFYWIGLEPLVCLLLDNVAITYCLGLDILCYHLWTVTCKLFADQCEGTASVEPEAGSCCWQPFSKGCREACRGWCDWSVKWRKLWATSLSLRQWGRVLINASKIQIKILPIPCKSCKLYLLYLRSFDLNIAMKQETRAILLWGTNNLQLLECNCLLNMRILHVSLQLPIVT